MTKQEVDRFTGEGIAMHTDWISKIELVIRGVNSHKSLKPVAHTECEFGKKYQEMLIEFHSNPYFKAITTPHKGLHDMYIKIYQTLNEEKPMFTSESSWKKKQLAKAEDMFNNMIVLSERFEKVIQTFDESYTEK